MRRKLVILSIVAVLLVGVAGVVVVWRQSIIGGTVRAGVEARLSAALGQRVTIGEIGFSIAPRPAFIGSNIRVGRADREAPAVHLERIRLVPQIRSFFSDVVRIDEVRLDGFTVSILRDRQGRWHVPAAFPAPSADGAAGVAIEHVRIAHGRLRIFDASESGAARETSSLDEIRADVLIDAAGLRLDPLGGRVGRAAITGTAIADSQSVRLTFDAPAIADEDLPALLGLLGAGRPSVVRLDQPAAVSVTATIDRATSRLNGSGTIRIPALTVQPLRLERVEAPFTMQGARITFSPTTLVLNEGKHNGRVTVALDSDPPRWSSDSRMESIDAGALLDALAARDAKIDGRGQITARLQGRLESNFMNGIDGRARLVLSDGVLHEFPLLATVNRALRLSEGDSRDTRFERLAVTLTIARAVAMTDDLEIDAGHLRVEAVGRIGFDGALDLRGRALVSAERVAAGVASVRELARLKNSRGQIEIPLTIAGTFDEPHFGLDMGAAIRQGVRDELKRRLRGLIRREPPPWP